MKKLIPAMLAVAISVLPLGAMAGEPPAPMGPPAPMFENHLNLTDSQRQQFEQIMHQTHQQMEQLHTQARAKVLGSLSAAHRALLAQVVGSLAVSPNPDPQAAVKQLNAALTPAEAQAVVSTHGAAMQQMHQLMESAHQRFQALLTAQQRAQLPNGGNGPPGGPPDEVMQRMSQLSAGEILLHFANVEMEDHMYGGGMMMMVHP
jgi:Spy/CpxP family protein refolding chaperone